MWACDRAFLAHARDNGTVALAIVTLGLTAAPSDAARAPKLDDTERQRLAVEFGETLVRKLDAQSLMDDEPVAPADIGRRDDPVVAAWRVRGATNLLTAWPSPEGPAAPRSAVRHAGRPRRGCPHVRRSFGFHHPVRVSVREFGRPAVASCGDVEVPRPGRRLRPFASPAKRNRVGRARDPSHVDSVAPGQALRSTDLRQEQS